MTIVLTKRKTLVRLPMCMCKVHRVRGVGVTEVKGLDVQEVIA